MLRHRFLSSIIKRLHFEGIPDLYLTTLPQECRHAEYGYPARLPKLHQRFYRFRQNLPCLLIDLCHWTSRTSSGDTKSHILAYFNNPEFVLGERQSVFKHKVRPKTVMCHGLLWIIDDFVELVQRSLPVHEVRILFMKCDIVTRIGVFIIRNSSHCVIWEVYYLALLDLQYITEPIVDSFTHDVYPLNCILFVENRYLVI